MHEAPQTLEEMVLYLAVASLSLPITGGVVYGVDAVYSGVKSVGQVLFRNPNQMTVKELYKTNFRDFFAGSDFGSE